MRFVFILLFFFSFSGLIKSQTIIIDSLKLIYHSDHPSVTMPPSNIRYQKINIWKSEQGNEYIVYNCLNTVYFSLLKENGEIVPCDSVYFNGLSEITFHDKYCYLTYFMGGTVIDMSHLPDSVCELNFINSREQAPLLKMSDTLYFSKSLANKICVVSLANPLNPLVIYSGNYPWPPAAQIAGDTLLMTYGTIFCRGKFFTAENNFRGIDTIKTAGPAGPFNYYHFLLENELLLFRDPGVNFTRIYDVTTGVLLKTRLLFISNEKIKCSGINKNLIAYTLKDGIKIFRRGSDFSQFVSFNTSHDILNAGIVAVTKNNKENLLIALDQVSGIYVLKASYRENQQEPERIPTYDLTVFPNPSREQLVVKIRRDYKSEMTLHDMKGKLVFRKDFESDIDYTIDVKLLPKGQYILKIEGAEGILTNKIIVEP